MFCRLCYYDLQGQPIPRCPECGTHFAFDDSGSFLHKTPGRLARVLFWLRRRRRVLLVAMTILLLCGYAVASAKSPSVAYLTYPSRLAVANLKSVMMTWIIQQHVHPQQTAFDIDAAKRDTRPSLSPWSEGRAAQRRAFVTYGLVWGPLFVVPTLAYLLAVTVLVGKRARRGVVVLIVALSFVLTGSLSPHETAGRLYRGSYAFLNDSVRLPGIDLTRANPRRGRTIAAYDAQSFRGSGRRIIAFADGHVECLCDERARPLFQAQGVPYPEPTD